MTEQTVMNIGRLPDVFKRIIEPKTMQEKYGYCDGKQCGECPYVLVNFKFELCDIVAHEKEVVRCGICLQRVGKSTCACGKFPKKEQP